jgi:type VI secretion system VasD/TssJ family lipoprotein
MGPLASPWHTWAVRIWWLLFLTIAVTTGACGPLRRKPSMVVRMHGEAGMNAVDKRPNAAVVRVYQLTSRANFDRASRAALWRDDTAALGNELVAKQELTLVPDAQEELKIGLAKSTRFVAVAADFYNPDGETWRVVYPAKSGKKPVKIRLGERQLSVQ